MPQHTPDLPPELRPLAEMPLLKRLAARLFGHGLTRLRAQHRFSWLHGQADGFRSGHTAGVEYGYKEGKADGIEEGRQVLLIRDFRPDEHTAPGVDDNLFDDWRLPLTAELKKRIKADVARLLPAHAQPSAAQWKMIFSDTPSTSVIAGAGAGKSTSLVLRILLLTHYLGFELSSMTVVTFTRESRKDFINKLMEILALWGQPLGMKDAQAVVRTFHSRILPMVRSLPGLERLQAFENLNARTEAGFDEADSNPFELRINDAQRQQLNACYHRLHGRHERFRELIAPLARHALQLKELERDHPDVQKRVAVTELAAKRDEELCDVIEDLWFRAGAWPIKGIEPNRQTFDINGAKFHCHGYIAELDAWVVLGFDPRENAQVSRLGSKLSVRAEWAVKRTLFQAFCRKPLIWLESYESSKRLLSSLAGDATAGPGFDYKVKGELGSAPLLDSFVAAAGFIENLGLDVPTAVGKMSFAKDDPDRFYFEALSIFWKALEDHLLDQSPPVMTYNRMFSLFGENTPENLKLLSDPLLRPMSHLMIDEFQDVSPQIVSWIRASLREIRSRGPAMHVGRGAQRSSLLCVGDDWQSIYGWRGSSPKYFMEFNKEFPSPTTTRVMLGENYRSHQHVIDAAEHIVRAAPAISGKKAKASGTAKELVPVTVRDRDDAALGQQLLAHYQKGDSVLMLYRKSSDKSLIQEHIQSVVNVDSSLPYGSRRLKQLTYHSAKGLQADAVFLLGDCQHLTSSPYKNQVYRMAGLGKDGDTEAYDSAQKDEVLRLAYVGITRAVSHCYWYVDGQDGQGVNVPKASDRVAEDKPFFDDQRISKS
ncbi:MULTISPECIES: UvrD-helicase domain-containing protein [unclassified Pseudomonas]|uniref:UvrD-helicase domain-containing protein n=1 Tax=unclassified Pseudomonas TaxID=196821 RepID=UPI000C86C611|nr:MULTISPECIES: UvrD-helicase domain-containing protein [unclassified Pseudomonas]PMU25895.1 DNA helicase UvrD [Pseudomonas sp. GP01-A9]PMU30358.1 DNA helicase UvrD [Pseudomonas sp. GP01-A13]PMU42570.1 DNA helicase UvrD [Pseudomonas sp. GP01-A8]PMU50045.1 DNA helicase UvrD [Pseudomonas sp. GP01-A14]PMU55638.1 DNA helicase UvrD [Pseudomonas sp. GP01-A6]